jgi:hypothetical protein
MSQNDEVARDEGAGAKAFRAAAFIETAIYRGRTDLLELAIDSNSRIAELQRQVVALSRTRFEGPTSAEDNLQGQKVRDILAQAIAEGRRFDAIEGAMDEATLIRFWNKVGVPARA